MKTEFILTSKTDETETISFSIDPSEREGMRYTKSWCDLYYKMTCYKSEGGLRRAMKRLTDSGEWSVRVCK
jgi:hypothetical protein